MVAKLDAWNFFICLFFCFLLDKCIVMQKKESDISEDSLVSGNVFHCYSLNTFKNLFNAGCGQLGAFMTPSSTNT